MYKIYGIGKFEKDLKKLLDKSELEEYDNQKRFFTYYTEDEIITLIKQHNFSTQFIKTE